MYYLHKKEGEERILLTTDEAQKIGLPLQVEDSEVNSVIENSLNVLRDTYVYISKGNTPTKSEGYSELGNKVKILCDSMYRNPRTGREW